MQYDAIIIGGGPAGLAAAAHTIQHHLKTLVISPDLSGKALYRLHLPWLRDHEAITGENTAEHLRQRFVTTQFAAHVSDSVMHVERSEDRFEVATIGGTNYSGRALIVATGVSPTTLGVPGEQRLLGYGVSYSAVSHAALFAGHRVVVVGSNLRALRATAALRLLASHVTMLVSDYGNLAGTPLGQRLAGDERVTLLDHHTVAEIVGEPYVSGVTVVEPGGTRRTLPADGVFIELGLEAHTEFLGGLVERTVNGQIVVDESCATHCPGLFAAGDITSSSYAEQMLIAMGEGAKAGISACAYLFEA